MERVIALDDVRQDIAMLRTSDGHARIELATFHKPKAISAEPTEARVNALGIRHIMFAVDVVEDVVARLCAHGAELVGELAWYEDHWTHRLPDITRFTLSATRRTCASRPSRTCGR
ncbi:hypothetical protein [Streptomyces sp. NPDC086776]|uniref:hypothetical protein n=1 Tax=Streptomyces sp. NPDC086776 TaxID=3365756 RepID=UPI00382DE843